MVVVGLKKIKERSKESHNIPLVRMSIVPSISGPFVFRFGMITCKHQWIFTKLSMCIDIVEIWLGIVNGQILTELSARDMPIFSFLDDNLCKCQGIFTNLVHALILRRSGVGLLMDKFRQCLTELSVRDTIMAGYYSLTFLFNQAYVLLHWCSPITV